MQATNLRTLFHLKIPAAMPSLLSGIRLAAVYAPIGATIGEWVGSSEGLGYLMLLANGRVKTDLMFAALFTLGALSIALYGLINITIHKFLFIYENSSNNDAFDTKLVKNFIQNTNGLAKKRRMFPNNWATILKAKYLWRSICKEMFTLKGKREICF